MLVWRPQMMAIGALAGSTDLLRGLGIALLLSGTPVQNSTDELYSLLHFLQLPGVAATHAAWTAAMASAASAYTT